jgi:alpha-D-ribose 1-methylphosphonate 5-triphosphate synthase subunit PhnL
MARQAADAVFVPASDLMGVRKNNAARRANLPTRANLPCRLWRNAATKMDQLRIPISRTIHSFALLIMEVAEPHPVSLLFADACSL